MDLFTLPPWAQWVIALVTVVVVVAAALIVVKPDSTSSVPVTAIVAALIAFAFLAWRAQRR